VNATGLTTYWFKFATDPNPARQIRLMARLRPVGPIPTYLTDLGGDGYPCVAFQLPNRANPVYTRLFILRKMTGHFPYGWDVEPDERVSPPANAYGNF
jgi:hypothetical protein